MNLSQEQVKKMDLYICPECDDQENDNKKLENGEEASPKDESYASVTYLDWSPQFRLYVTNKQASLLNKHGHKNVIKQPS